MSWKPALWLGLLILLVGSGMLMFDRGSEVSPGTLPRPQPLMAYNPDTLTRLALVAGELSVECVRREGHWFMIRPIEARADEARIRKLVEALSGSMILERLAPGRLAERRLTTASFGLESPRARIVAGTDTRSTEWLIGATAPFGDVTYLQERGAADILGVNLRLEELVSADEDGFRSHAIFPASFRKIVKVDLKQASGFIQLVSRDGQWRIQQPFDARADQRQVESLLQLLRGLKIESFGAPFKGTPPALYGLTPDEAVIQFSVLTEGAREPFVVVIGKPRPDQPGLNYAWIGDVSSVCSVNRDVLALQGVKAESLRDRRLFQADPALVKSIKLQEGDSRLLLGRQETGEWLIHEPFRYKADPHAVSALLKAVGELKTLGAGPAGQTNALGRGAEPVESRCRVILSAFPALAATNGLQANGSGPTNWSYRFSLPEESGEGVEVFADETRTYHRVAAETLRKLWPKGGESGLSDPRYYMDRRILEMEPDQVRRITLTREGRDETVSLANDGLWKVDSPPDGQMVKGAIAGVLNAACRLRADRFETMNATNALRYGISESSPRITFGLIGTSGIQKTILFGAPAGTNGTFAMVQGQDVVIVLNAAGAEVLTKPLVETR